MSSGNSKTTVQRRSGCLSTRRQSPKPLRVTARHAISRFRFVPKDVTLHDFDRSLIELAENRICSNGSSQIRRQWFRANAADPSFAGFFNDFDIRVCPICEQFPMLIDTQ